MKRPDRRLGGVQRLTTPLLRDRRDGPLRPVTWEVRDGIGVLKLSEPPHMVAIQLKILMPVGTAMIIVAATK